jgi:hypothetical protein
MTIAERLTRLRSTLLWGPVLTIGLAGCTGLTSPTAAPDRPKEASEDTAQATDPAGATPPARISDEVKPIAPADFKDLQALIKPRPGEASWEEIPWMTNLWAARKKAALEGKPLFVWSASADPLGCT